MTSTEHTTPGSMQEHLGGHAQYTVPGLQHSLIHDERHQQLLQQQRQRQPSIKALAITPRITTGTTPPPLMGSTIVLVNDSALHCFGGRLESRELTNCHYILDVETGYWEAIQPAPVPQPASNTDQNATDSRALFSLSLTTDPVNTNSGSLSDALSIPPQPRYFHTLNAYGTSLIAFGGMGTAQARNEGDDSDNEGDQRQSALAALGDLHVYDIITRRWQQKHPRINEHTPKARWAHLATVLDHYLVIIGGTDTAKNYIEDACVLDLRTWEWVSSIKNIGQCGSYRTVAATGPSIQASSEFTPSSPSFPSADASSPQTSSNLSWPTTESGSIDAMASISMVLSGHISMPSSTTSSQSMCSSSSDKPKSSNLDGNGSKSSSKKTSERLMSGDLTPAFKTGKEMPSIYLYSNFNFQNLQRDLKVITPNYTHPSMPPTFTISERSETLGKMIDELPPGLRFPQGHVYQNQLILTGTLIFPGKLPTLAIYAFNLTMHRWHRLDTDTMLEQGSWCRTLLHPATGFLFVFGNRGSNPDSDYSKRIQHHDHLMTINLQAYGFYERPVPSFLPTAQDLGQDLLREPGLNDMHIASATGTLFDANSTILASRWPEFATMLLSPPYVTPLILVLPVPDEVVSIFLQYLYTGALPVDIPISPGATDYLLILARRYQLNGLHALALDMLHQSVVANPIRTYSSALMAGELGLQARAVGLAMSTPPTRISSLRTHSTSGVAARTGTDSTSQPSSPLPPANMPRRKPSIQVSVLDSGLSRNYSTRVPPPSSRPPVPPERRRAASHHSRDSVSTDGGLVGETILQQYNPTGASSASRSTPTPRPLQESEQQPLFLSTPEPTSSRQRKLRTPPLPPTLQQTSFSTHPMSFMSTSSGNSSYDGSLNSPLPRNQHHHQQYVQNSYPSPLSPGSQHHPSFTFQGSQGGYAPSLRATGSDGAPSVHNYDDQDDGSSMYTGIQSRELRTQQAKRRLQMQMQHDLEQQQLQNEFSRQQQHEFSRQQQQMLLEQQLRDEEMMIQQHRMLQKQQRQTEATYNKPVAALGALDYRLGGHPGSGSASSKSFSSKVESHSTMASSIVETVSSQKSSSSKAASLKSSKSDEKKKGLLSKMKPPKPKSSGADLMKSAGF
ncbi:hypothetical protein BG011_007405 [Mortierella polycephala]|uniref:BTB domain-containing protein n=1 Tax=Mortierella polycephala TaxID=41804 RepID=A0A9P6QCB4_9FUNG|nr:hypothetical protein BG011_007405 [Mortierella polycephala]